MERIAGTVVGEGTVLFDATLEVKGQTRRESSPGGTFALELDGGQTVTVTFAQPPLGPPEEHQAPWAELEGRPLAEPFAPWAPGGHVEVSLQGVAVRGGDRVVVEGEVVRRTAADGYRGSDAVQLESVRAHRVGVGEGAERWLDLEGDRQSTKQEKERRESEALEAKREAERERAKGPRPLPITASAIGIGVGSAAVVFGAVAAFAELGLHHARFFALALGLQLLLGSLYGLRKRRPLPRMGPFRSKKKGTGLAWKNTEGRVAIGVGWAATAFLGLGVVMESASYAVPALMIAGVSGVVLAARAYFVAREDMRTLRILASAEPATGDGWGLRWGTVVEGSIARQRTHAHQSSTSTESYTDDDGRVRQRQVTQSWWEFGERGSGTDQLEIETAAGRLVVHPTKGIWGTTDHRVNPEKLTLTQRIGAGHSLAVLGRIDGGAVKAAGPESLFLFGTVGPDPVAAARRQVRLQRGFVVALVVLGAGGIAAGWWNVAQDHRAYEPVVESSTFAGVQPGDRCSLRIGYLPGGRSGLPHRCQATMVCGDHQVFGGLDAGFFDCDMDASTGHELDASDGDGAIELRPDGHGRAWTPKGSVSFRLR